MGFLLFYSPKPGPSGGSVAQWSELGIWIQKTRVQIPDSDYWMDLSSVILGANSPRFVNSQLFVNSLLPVGILNWEKEGKGILIWYWKAPLGELSLSIYYLFIYYEVNTKVVPFVKANHLHPGLYGNVCFFCFNFYWHNSVEIAQLKLVVNLGKTINKRFLSVPMQCFVVQVIEYLYARKWISKSK